MSYRWSYVLKQPDAAWPRRRYAHSSVFVPRSAPGPFAGCLVVYGGRTLGGQLLADLWTWNERDKVWREFVQPEGAERPPGTCYSSVTLVDNGRLVLFGGQTVKSARGSKLLWFCEEGRWWLPPVALKRQRRFRHTAWYNHALRLFCIYGGISGHAWHVDVCALPLEERGSSASSWRVLPSPAGMAVSGSAIQSEVCVVLDANHVMALGSSYARVLQVVGTSTRLVGSLDELPPGWRGNSPGVNACLVHPNHILVLNLLPKVATPMLRVQWNSGDGSMDASLSDVSDVVPHAAEAVCHDPPRPPTAPSTDAVGVFFNGVRWEKWSPQKAVHFFLIPKAANGPSRQPSPAAGSNVLANVVSQSFREMSDEELESRASDRRGINSEAGLEEEEDEEEEAMPLLYVRQHKQRSLLKRLIDAMLSWEKRGAVDAHKKVSRKRSVSPLGEDVKDDEQDLDCFGRQDDRHEFDWTHFGFTLLRGLLLLPFALVYLFSSRFSLRAKLALVVLGLVNVGVVAIPVVTYAWPPAMGSSLKSEIALVWAPLVFYVFVVFVHSTVEGNWRDSGGSAASLNYLDSYECSVFVKQSSHSSKRASRVMRGGELVSCLIEYEESVMQDPWEYFFLSFILSPFLGLVKAGLFILVDYLLVSEVVPIDADPFVHVVFALAMLLNAVTMTGFLCLLGLSAYIYRRQLRLLRLVSGVISKRESARVGIPFLPLRSVANVRVWSAMRTFAMSDKSYLPLGSANSAVGYTLVLTGILWIVLLVSVFVDRSRRLLLVPINISLAFFAVVLFYYVTVCIRQHLLLNKHLRSHSTLLGREGIRVQLAIDIRGDKAMEPAGRLLKHLNDLLKMELSYFRIMGIEINQNTLNSMLGLFLTLSVATLTNIIIDVGSGN